LRLSCLKVAKISLFLCSFKLNQFQKKKK